MMASNPVPVRIPVVSPKLGAPGLVDVHELDTASSTLAFERGEELPGSEEREDRCEPLPILAKPRLVASEVEVFGDHRHALASGDEGEEAHGVLDRVVAPAKVPSPSVEEPSVSRNKRCRDVVCVEVEGKRPVCSVGTNGRLGLLAGHAQLDLASMAKQLEPMLFVT